MGQSPGENVSGGGASHEESVQATLLSPTSVVYRIPATIASSHCKAKCRGGGCFQKINPNLPTFWDRQMQLGVFCSSDITRLILEQARNDVSLDIGESPRDISTPGQFPSPPITCRSCLSENLTRSKLSCRRETARRFVSLAVWLSGNARPRSS